MLRPYARKELSAEDVKVFDLLVRRDHWVRQAAQHVDFLEIRQVVGDYYRLDFGCPCVEPVLLIKLEFLMYHDNLSDSQVFARAETDMAYRWFLDLGRNDHLPDVSTLRKFRSRLGPEGHKAVFHCLLKQAREHGLVKDRLRIKDATHVIADIAVPAGLTLIAQARNRLLNAAEPFAPESVAGEYVRIENIRTTTDGRADDLRLIARVDHLRDILGWATKIAAPPDAETNPTWQKLIQAIEIARKTLAGHDNPEEGDKLRSVSDPEARRGRHGEFYDGYLVDVMVDADSELITAINVLSANGGGESADALALLREETSLHGNTIEKLSMDGAGYNGPVLRQLEEDHSVEVFVPAKADSQQDRISADAFQLSEDGSHVICPAGQKSHYHQREDARHTTIFRFTEEVCRTCPLLSQCVNQIKKPFGRSVRKNDYLPEYERVRERAKTPEYAAVKKEHPLIERKLGQLMNRYRCRRARYRGQPRVLSQMIMGATAANLNRIIRLLDTGVQIAFG
jgi:transposase